MTPLEMLASLMPKKAPPEWTDGHPGVFTSFPDGSFGLGNITEEGLRAFSEQERSDD